MFRLASVAMLLLASSLSWAERDPLSGSLGLWLKNTAAPELVEVLSRHPKFKGEQIRFVTLQDGKPAQRSNRLNEAIEQLLTHRILQAGKNDVAWQSGAPTCARVRARAPYLVGIEVSTAGRYKHRVTLGILDTAEGVWVSGVSLSWSGRLLTAETQALADQVASAPAGSLFNPIPLTQREQLVEVIQTQVGCALPHGLDGTVHVQLAEQPDAQLIVRELAQRMALTTTITTTRNPQEADWQMHAAIQTAGFANEFTINLAPRDDPAAVQRVAAVFVTGAMATTPPVPGPVAAAKPSTSKPSTQTRTILGNLRIADSCDRAARNRCVEVAFDLRESAHVLVFRTHNTLVHPTSCSSARAYRASGEHRYRVKLPELSDDERAGIYVLASRKRSAIRPVQQQILQAPGACGSRSAEQHGRWLADTLDAVAAQGDALEWRALHVRTVDSQLERL